MSNTVTVPREFLWELVEMARHNQNYEYFSGSLDGGQYDQGYEAGRFGAGDDLEQLLRERGFWSER